MKGRERQEVSPDLLVANEAANGEAAPAHAVHEAARQTFSTGAAMIAIRVHGDGLGPSADERILATTAKGRVQGGSRGHVDVVVVSWTVVDVVKVLHDKVAVQIVAEAGRVFLRLVGAGVCAVRTWAQGSSLGRKGQ